MKLDLFTASVLVLMSSYSYRPGRYSKFLWKHPSAIEFPAFNRKFTKLLLTVPMNTHTNLLQCNMPAMNFNPHLDYLLWGFRNINRTTWSKESGRKIT
jgi:hypothetical protein